MSNKTEHLNMIQNVITRMAHNSLQIKCWAMAIMAAMIVLSNGFIIAAGLVPLIVFWLLDSRYLALERAFRKLYDDVRVKEESEIDFSMDIKGKIPKGMMRTWSELWFYLPMTVLLIAMTVYYVVF